MKIIHFIAGIDKTAGGTTAYMQLLASQLKNKLDLIVATGVTANPVTMEGVKVKYFNTALRRWFAMQKEFDSFLKSEKPDLVHINGIWNPENWLFQKVSQKIGIKVIISPHGMLDPYILRRNPLKKKIALGLYQNKALKRSDHFHATSKLERENIVTLGYIQTVSVIPNAIDIHAFPSIPPTKKETPKKILYLSRIHPQKGIEYLIDAWSTLPHSLRSNWNVEIIGNGENNYINTLQQKINKAQLQTQIHIKAPVFGTEKINIIRSARIFVLPSFSECFGIVVAESLASYTPVITTRNTPWNELQTSHCGWWIDLSVENLVAALTSAINTPSEELKNMGLNGRKLVEEKFDIQVVAEGMIRLYKLILKVR